MDGVITIFRYREIKLDKEKWAYMERVRFVLLKGKDK